MTKEITSTQEMAELEQDGLSYPEYPDNDMTATEGHDDTKDIQFHVQMRGHTMRDMEALIVEAAAQRLMEGFGDPKLRKEIEERCMVLVTEKANAVLSGVSDQIIDQPVTLPFGKKEQVTMREMIGLYGNEYLTQQVNEKGEPEKSTYYKQRQTRMAHIVQGAVSRDFKREITAATNAAISEVRKEINEKYAAIMDAEKKRFTEALAKASS